ncbi:phage tail protein [Pseudomonas sp. BF-R-26]|uniref:phage tail protein n=1 Tax=Pseudomonas sp. BF-R-26 TaxID=2832398 RepID=UPI001CBD7F78|nr:phage tail protein [Pseudomonas sp. BF-R-26]
MAAQEFYTILTKAGIQYEAECKATGKPIKLVKMSVGDGNGASYNPVDTQVALKRKVWEGSFSNLYQDKTNTAWLVVEAIIPQNVGGFWIREVAVWTDTGVLYAIGKYPESFKPLIATGAGREINIRTIFTTSNADNVTLMLDGSVIQATRAWVKEFVEVELASIKKDLSAEHAEGKTHNYPLTNFIETDWVAESSQSEYLAEIFRTFGQSGVLGSRQYGSAGTESFNRTFDGAYSAINLHNHPNLLATPGLGEIAAMINGHMVRTRHNDYRLRSAAPGNYLAMVDIAPPAAPASVNAAVGIPAKVAEMREYFRAFATRDTEIRDYRPHFRWNLSVLEIWPELLTDEVNDTFESFRHLEEINGYRDLLTRTFLMGATGYSGRNENGSFIPGSVRQVSKTGRPQYVAWRYRISVADVGSVGDYPVEKLLTPLDLPLQRWHANLTGPQVATSRRQRWRINRELSADPTWGAYNESPTIDLLDELMAKVPGLNGAGANLVEQYTDSGVVTKLTKWDSAELLNAAYYNRRYGHERNASGRTKGLRSYNDPTLFVASNTRPEVASFAADGQTYRNSYAIPLELILRTPLEGWNPYGIATVNAAVGDGATAQTAWTGRSDNSRHYLTPAEMFSDTVLDPDPADTGASPRWVLDSAGTPRLVRASGIYAVLPKIEGAGGLYLRYPVYPMYHEGGWAAAAVDALAGDCTTSLVNLMRGYMTQKESIAEMGESIQVLKNEVSQLKQK